MNTFMTYTPADRLYKAAAALSQNPRVIELSGDASFLPEYNELLEAMNVCDAAIAERDACAREIALAREQATDELEIDDDPVLSRGDEGCWVSAWIWVPGEPEEE